MIPEPPKCGRSVHREHFETRNEKGSNHFKRRLGERRIETQLIMHNGVKEDEKQQQIGRSVSQSALDQPRTYVWQQLFIHI